MKTIKKAYVQPSTQVVEVELPNLLNGSPIIDPNEEGNGNDAGSREFLDDEWL